MHPRGALFCAERLRRVSGRWREAAPPPATCPVSRLAAASQRRRGGGGRSGDRTGDLRLGGGPGGRTAGEVELEGSQDQPHARLAQPVVRTGRPRSGAAATEGKAQTVVAACSSVTKGAAEEMGPRRHSRHGGGWQECAGNTSRRPERWNDKWVQAKSIGNYFGEIPVMLVTMHRAKVVRQMNLLV